MSLGVKIQTNYAWGLIAKIFSRNLIFLVPQIDDQRVSEVKKFDRKRWSKIFDFELKINMLFISNTKNIFWSLYVIFRKLTPQIKLRIMCYPDEEGVKFLVTFSEPILLGVCWL